MDHPLLAPDAVVRPWRTAAYVAGAVALVELLLLIAIGGGALVKSVSGRIQLAAQETVAAAPAAPAAKKAAVASKPAKATVATRPRGKTVVLVLNGNGRTGAASAAAARVRGKGYPIGGVGNAARSDYPRSIVMYKPGFAAEGARLGRDLKVRMVVPLDGMRASALGRAHLVLILGA